MKLADALNKARATGEKVISNKTRRSEIEIDNVSSKAPYFFSEVEIVDEHWIVGPLPIDAPEYVYVVAKSSGFYEPAYRTAEQAESMAELWNGKAFKYRRVD